MQPERDTEQFIWSEQGCWLFTTIDGTPRTSFVGFIRRESLKRFCELHRIEFVELADAVGLANPSGESPSFPQAA